MVETKKCENCGKTFVPEQPHHRYCSSRCHQEAQGRREGGGRQREIRPPKPDTRTDFRFTGDYLKDGYLVEKEVEIEGKKQPKKVVRPEVVDELAINVAKALGNAEPKMKSHQLRRFFNKMRAIEAKLDTVKSFELVKPDILGFKRDVAYAAGRGVVADEFKQFIDRNVGLAVQSEDDFRLGFIEHFQSVLAYFVYYFRDR
jgi:CRISPR type III-A-associated protein Csm2